MYQCIILYLYLYGVSVSHIAIHVEKEKLIKEDRQGVVIVQYPFDFFMTYCEFKSVFLSNIT